MKRTWLPLLACMGAPLLVGALSGMATVEGVETWYRTIEKPPFTPPDAVFGPVWTALYLAMGVAAFLVWRSDGDRTAVRSALWLFGVQLVANGSWSILFFGMRSPGLAFLEILVLLALIAATIVRFAGLSRAAARLMAPYLAWVLFAAVLNLSIWRLNA